MLHRLGPPLVLQDNKVPVETVLLFSIDKGRGDRGGVLRTAREERQEFGEESGNFKWNSDF